jgi:hypothetical protein
MDEVFSAVLRPDVLVPVMVSAIGATALTAMAFMFFLSRAARKTIETMGTTASKTVEAAGSAIEHLADKSAEVVLPVSEGLKDILESVADRVRLKQRELNDITAEKVSLAQEVERLQARRIDVTKITAQLRLGLIEVSQQYHSFKQQRLAVTEKPPLVGSATATDYLGLHRATYRTSIGLDVERLQFAMTEDNCIWVHGLRDVQVLGMKELAFDELLDEIRHLTLEDSGRAKGAEILINDVRLQEYAREHRAVVLREIQSPQSVQHLAGATAEFGLAFLQACLGAGRFKVTESREPIRDGLSFIDLCRRINEQVAESLKDLQSRRGRAEERGARLQDEMVHLLDAPGALTRA